MTIALLIYAVVMTVGFAGIVYPRTRKLFLTAPPKETKLLAASAGSPLAEWKTIFRDTVVAVDGGLTPEMEAFLVSDEVAKVREAELAKRLLVEAREQAKQELDELLDGEDVDGRKLLDGAAYKEFCADFNASSTEQEKLNAVALGVPGEARLVELGRTLTAAGISHVSITETEGAFAGQVMAIGCCPAPKAKLKKFFSSIPPSRRCRAEQTSDLVGG